MNKLIRRTLMMCLLLCCATVMPVSAQDSDTDERIDAIISASEAEVIQSYPSPDGAYRAEVTVYPCVDIGEELASYERLDLVNNDTNEAQLVAEQVINCGGLGAFGLGVQRWSMDGAYLYYTDAREGTPDGFAGGWVAPVYRVQIMDLQVDRLGQAMFSMDGAWLAVWDASGISVMPSDSSEATDFALMPEGLEVIQVVWMPDNNGLLYIQADARFGPVGRNTVTHIDLADGEQTVLLDSGN